LRFIPTECSALPPAPSVALHVGLIPRRPPHVGSARFMPGEELTAPAPAPYLQQKAGKLMTIRKPSSSSFYEKYNRFPVNLRLKRPSRARLPPFLRPPRRDPAHER
jgi:hypothetical protein